MSAPSRIASLDKARFDKLVPMRGYHVPYMGAATPCPGCGRSHWYVGLMSAECAFCATAIPLPEPVTSGVGVVRVSRRKAA